MSTWVPQLATTLAHEGCVVCSAPHQQVLIYLLYQYESTKTDAGAQFTCVRLRPRALRPSPHQQGGLVCSTSDTSEPDTWPSASISRAHHTALQNLRAHLLPSVYLRYQYKSTNIDAGAAGAAGEYLKRTHTALQNLRAHVLKMCVPLTCVPCYQQSTSRAHSTAESSRSFAGDVRADLLATQPHASRRRYAKYVSSISQACQLHRVNRRARLK